MTNQQKFDLAFTEVFNVAKQELKDLQYKLTPAWDSITSIQLIMSLEHAFGITVEREDYQFMTSYQGASKTLCDKYKVRL